MALERIQVPVALTGLDTKTDERLTTKAINLENAVFTKALSLRKRNGYSKIGSTISESNGTRTSIDSGDALAVYKDELLYINQGTLYSYLSSQDSFISKGNLSSSIISSDSIVRNSASQNSPTMASNGTISLWAWADTRGGIRASIIDEASGTYLQADVSVASSGYTPRAIEIGNALFLVYGVDDGGTSYIKARRLTPDNPQTFDSEVTLTNTLLGAFPTFDIVASGTHAVLAWNSTSSAIKVAYITQTGAVGSSLTGLPSPATLDFPGTYCIAVVTESNGNIFVLGHNSSSGLKVRGLRADFSNLYTTKVIDSTTSPLIVNVTAKATSGALKVFYEVNAASNKNHYIKKNTVSASGTVGTASTVVRSVGLASKCFTYGDYTYFSTVHVSTLQSTYFIIREDGFIEAKVLKDVAGTFLSQLPAVTESSSGIFVIPNQVKTKFISEGTAQYSLLGVNKTTIDFTSSRRFQYASLGNNLHFVGGYLQSYDGQSVTEQNFHLYPEDVTASASTTGGYIAASNYQYAVTYEWMDAQGQLHRSATSVPLSVTVGGSGNGSVTLTVPTLRLTAKQGSRANPVICVYRTEGNGTVFYKVSGTTVNDPTADTVSITDTLVDSDIISNAYLYTTGNVLDNQSPGACSLITTLKNRLIISGLEDKDVVQYSKEVTPGEGVAFSDLLSKRIDPQGGSISAIGVMDDKVITFKKDRILFYSGYGPDDTGNQDDYSLAQLISSDAGCDNPLSVITYANGLLFQSKKGIYELDRALRVSYVGAPVERYNSNAVVSADLIEGTNQIRFLIDDSPGCILYDYYFNQWSTFTRHESKDAVIWNGSYVLLKNDAQIWKETENYFKDVNQPIRRKIETGWIKVNGVQGFQRVHRILVLGDYKSKHLIRVGAAFDYENTYKEYFTWNAENVLDSSVFGDESTFGADDVFGGVSDSVYQFRCHLANQKNQSIKLLIEDIYSDGDPGEASIISDVTLEMSVKRGTAKLKSAKSL